MKRIILSAIILLSGVIAGYAQEAEAVKPSFWNNTYVQAGDGGALSTMTGVGNVFEISAGKMFNKCVGVDLDYTNIHIFDGDRSYTDHLIGVGFLWNFLGNVDTGIWKPVLSPEIGVMISGCQNLSSPVLPYICNSLNNYFRIHQDVDLALNLKSYSSLDPQNQGNVPYITIPTICLTVGARYCF